MASIHVRTGALTFGLSTFLVTVIACLSTPPATAGDNVLSNGTFDVDVAAWTAVGDATIDWNSMDANDDPGSGSATVTNVATYATSMGAYQCSAMLEGDREYLLRSMIYVPGGQDATGYGYVSIRLYDEPDCGGIQVYTDYSSLVYTATPDQWLESSLSLTAPPDAQSALVWLVVFKNEAPYSLSMAYDNVALFTVEVFADDFESGDTSAWSGTMP